MQYTINEIGKILGCTNTVGNNIIEQIVTDSRKIVFPSRALFFALSSSRRDGHQFIPALYTRGVRNFVVAKNYPIPQLPDTQFLQVNDVLQSLQHFATHHRNNLNNKHIPIVAITGSNGKTIVKEWLFQLLHNDYEIVRSPRSYNSRIGVPLSILQMHDQHNFAIFEAGISRRNEMEILEKIIQPTIGVFTHFGVAHSEGFANDKEKFVEKMKLFAHCNTIICCKDAIEKFAPIITKKETTIFSWSRKSNATLIIQDEKQVGLATTIQAIFQQKTIRIVVPFTDAISIENAITCWCVLLHLGYANDSIQARFQMLESVAMRLQLQTGINNCTIINDSYSNDFSSLRIALQYVTSQDANKKRTVILSDILESGSAQTLLYQQVANELQEQGITHFIGIGKNISLCQQYFSAIATTAFYDTTESFLQQATQQQFKNECILLKGARVFEFEQIVQWFSGRVHQTIMEVNLSAFVHNLKIFQNYIAPNTKIMAMVKAFSYGSGSVEIARLLQFHKVDYLSVAYTDEGVELRKAGISLPIMVMNVDENCFDALVTYNLEPEIYSFYVYEKFHTYLLKQGLWQHPIHIELNTGMARLGFEVEEVERIAQTIAQQNTMVIQSVFTHFVASEAEQYDAFTKQQALALQLACEKIQNIIGYKFLKHICNTAGAARQTNFQYNMVRLGIGLYGIDATKTLALENVVTVKSTIAQIRTIPPDTSVSYNRQWFSNTTKRIATVRIGYADGFSRQMSNGVGKVYVKGNLAPVVGVVCMDMMMIDITHIPTANTGDEVEIFGKNLSVETVADWCHTIPYEILTSISQRVKRVYIEE